jgi:pyridoxal phosphate enzyme (YggS family)
MPGIAERLKSVRTLIAEAAAGAGRAADEIELIAVSKTHPPESIDEAIAAGQFVFGESRVQEARVKIPQVASSARWHFIGHLQKNKVRHALPLFEYFHGIDSIEIARDVDRIADEAGLFPGVLLEVNMAGESSKFGFAPTQLAAAMEPLLELRRIDIRGLMTIAPLVEKAEEARRYFAGLRELRDQVAAECGVALPVLSMGMSGDFPIAIEEGATMVRVGTSIFGKRSGKIVRETID